MAAALQVLGALLILGGYAGAQSGKINHRSLVYLLLNLIGSLLLGILALREEQWGFVLLEGAWVLISLWGLATHARFGARPPSAGS